MSAARSELEPLASGDSRYVDISGGRSTIDLGMMRVSLGDFDARQDRFAKITFAGHRGCGKSTELLRLENDLAGRFTALHFFATEDEIIADYDYSELFLDLVDELVRKFQREKVPLDERLVEDISTWFAEVTLDEVETVKKDIEVSTEAEIEGEARRFLAERRLAGEAQIDDRRQSTNGAGRSGRSSSETRSN